MYRPFLVKNKNNYIITTKKRFLDYPILHIKLYTHNGMSFFKILVQDAILTAHMAISENKYHFRCSNGYEVRSINSPEISDHTIYLRGSSSYNDDSIAEFSGEHYISEILDALLELCEPENIKRYIMGR